MDHELRSPRVSIIIPYYNHGKFIDETLASVDRIADKKIYEVVIVNDGSTDPYSQERIAEIAKSGQYKVINQKNQGVCAARNNAIAHSQGEFILPLDSDNRLLPEFVNEAIRVLDSDRGVTIVYCDYNLFGAQTGVRRAGPFNLQRLMLGNYIDNCSMFRRSLITEIGGYDPFPPLIGNEDWELWLRAAFKGYKFHYIEKPLFDYRVAENSQITRLLADRKKGNANAQYLMEKYKDYYGPQYIDEMILGKFRSGFAGNFFKLILKLYFPKKFERMVAAGKLRKYL